MAHATARPLSPGPSRRHISAHERADLLLPASGKHAHRHEARRPPPLSPNCGEGRLYARYLKVDLDCEVCGHDLARYPADDGPAYFTILIIGHLVVAPLLLFPFIWKMSPVLVVPLTVLPLAALTLLLLPRVKGRGDRRPVGRGPAQGRGLPEAAKPGDLAVQAMIATRHQ